MTPIMLDTGIDYTIKTPQSRTSGSVCMVFMDISTSPLVHEEIPSKDLLDSIEELKEYKKGKNRKIYSTIGEIETTFG